MSNCVNTATKEFRQLVNSLNVSPGTIELVLHRKFMSNESSNHYPSPADILAELNPKPFVKASNSAIRVWATNYSSPKQFTSQTEADMYLDEAAKVFGNEAVALIQRKDGSFEAKVAPPSSFPYTIDTSIWSTVKGTLTEGASDTLLKEIISVYEATRKFPKVTLENLGRRIYVRNDGSTYQGVPQAEASANHIRFDKSNMVSKVTSGNSKERVQASVRAILTHEALHTVTLSAFDNVEAGKGTKEEIEFVKEIERLYNIVERELGDRAKDIYGMNNPKEFIAQIGNDAKFQELLARTKDPESKKSVWNKIIEAFTRVLKDKLDIDIKGSVLESALKEISTIMEYEKRTSTDSAKLSTAASETYKGKNQSKSEKTPISIDNITRESIATISNLLDFFRTNNFLLDVSNNKEGEAEKSTGIVNLRRFKDGNYYLTKHTEGINESGISKGTEASKNAILKVLSNLGLSEDVVTFTETGNGTKVTFNEESFKSQREKILEEGEEVDKELNKEISRISDENYNNILELFRVHSPELYQALKEERITLEDAKNSFEEEHGYSIFTEGQYYPSAPDTTAAFNEDDFINPEEESSVSQEDRFIDRAQRTLQQVDNLLSDNILSATEVRHIAEQAVFWISDHITELQENLEKAVQIYGEKMKDKDLSSMSRANIIRAIGPDNVIAMCKEKFSPENADFENDDTIDKAITITDNWDAVMYIAQDVFLEVEKFSILPSEDGKTTEVNEDLNLDADNFNAPNDEGTIGEIEGSQQEHWQVESRTIDVINSLSQAVRQELQKCYLLDKDGNHITSEFGINERITVREATSSILRWIQGATNLSEVIAKLEDKKADNPWLSQIVKRLSDTTGKETDFQSQFYSNFTKPFQTYSVVIVEDGKYTSIIVNESPALREAMTQVTTQYKIGEHPLFTTDGINKESFKELENAYNSLEKFKHSGYEITNDIYKKEAAETLGYISSLLGYYVIPDMVEANLTPENYRVMYSALHYIVKSLGNNLDNKTYEPFKFKGKDGISGNVREFLKPITEHLEDTAISAFYDSGKMYQSYVTPSYMTKLMNQFGLKGEAFDDFLMKEYGNNSWFHTGDNIERGWRNSWLRELATDTKTREIFKHKVQLNFNKQNYMRNMTDIVYTLSVLTEYFSESAEDKQARVPAWFRVPMLSNKPSSEFIRFYSERGTNYKETIRDKMSMIFSQELSRIQTVMMRNFDSKDPRFIKNFDKNGRKFMFLDFMNDYLTGDKKSSELGKLLNSKLNGEVVDETRLNELAKEAIYDAMDSRASKVVDSWVSQGIIEGAKKIKGIGVTEDEIRSNLENFVWNDTLAAMNIMELTITDIAYYKDAEDLQKRLAQIHAPGIRGNVLATDYEGNKVTDGKERTFYLKDFDDFKSNIIENVGIVFDRKIKAAPENEKAALRALKESLVGENGAYTKINVADAQGYSSPSSYRKKAFIFGKWSKKAEEVYQKLRKGEYNYSDLSVAFQPLKPFVYSQIEKSSGVENAPLENLKVPVQNKNSEYLLIMADAILQGEETGRPNLLRAIYEVMEESHYDEDGNYKLDGIDTVQFESTVKSGLMGRIDLNKYISLKGYGEAAAKAVMEACIYETTPMEYQAENENGEMETRTINKRTGNYSQTFVHEISFEDYCLQQEVPEHFKDHSQVIGSQQRFIVPSELATVDSFGNPVTYEVEGRKLSAEEFKRELEQIQADNIEESIQELGELLHIGSHNIKERNEALSKILQREILSSPRYGIDLLQACSTDPTGQFRIPPGDPIQSKRVEQLINSIIKNRVNKQEIAGGPVVQVTNFGTSRQLNIRFKDKNGDLLKTREEWESSPIGESYESYIKENQGGIAYFEVYAPIYSNTLFTKFADKDGNIDIETIEQINPDLLKMVGYRIPTEAKYSMAPLKIVGFLPREAGDGIMLPYDITLLTGSDFDVDKEYLMRKEIDIATRFIQKENESMTEAEKDYIKHNKQSISNYLIKAINLTGKITAEERAKIEKEATSLANLEKRTAKRQHEERLADIERRMSMVEDAIDNAEFSKNQEKDSEIYDKQLDRQEKREEKAIAKENKRYEEELYKIEERLNETISRSISKLEKQKVYDRVNQFLSTDRFLSSRGDDALTKALRKAYIDYMYHSVEPTSGRIYRNNKVVDMTYEVLTHETTAPELLNPGGFDPEKRMGYLVSAWRDPNNTHSWEELESMSIDELKDLSSKDKNLCFIDTHVQFYRQNAAASSLIGIFAVHRTAHAAIENEGYLLDVDTACKLDNPFTVAGMVFGGNMGIDVRFDRNGESIGKVLGSLVAASADAVKDPILNLMNININTASILTALVRMGMPFDDAALFLSQKSVTDAIAKFDSENITGYKSLSKVMDERIKDIEDELTIDTNSPIHTEELTREELIEGIKSDNPKIEYKVLKAFRNFQKIANALRMPTMATRFNSISSAVGPLILDNVMTEYKMKKLSIESNIKDSNGETISMEEIFYAHPVLNQFRRTLGIANSLFGNMPTNSTGFRNIIDTISETPMGDIIMNDRKLLSTLSDFYQSYLVVAGGVVDASNLSKVIGEFPKEFIKKNYKEKYPNNLLIQSIKYGTDKAGRATLQIDITGLDTSQKERLSSAWIDLHKANPELSMQLFEYSFFRGGIGFSPKTLMSLIPVYVKERIPKYVDTFRKLPSTIPEIVLDQFVRNNWDNNKLVPRKKKLAMRQVEGNKFEVFKQGDVDSMKNTQYFKMKVDGTDRLYRQVLVRDTSIVYEEISPLGSNKDYIEISTDEIASPTKVIAPSETAESKPTEATETIEDSEVNQINPEQETINEDNSLSDQQASELLYKAYMATGMRVEDVDKIVLKHKAKSEDSKAIYEKGLKDFLKKRFDMLGITYNEEMIDKVYKRMC